MGFAPNGLKVGDIYENDNGKKVRVVRVDVNPCYTGYITEEVKEDIPLKDLPFAPEDEAITLDDAEEAPKKRGRKKKAE